MTLPGQWYIGGPAWPAKIRNPHISDILRGQVQVLTSRDTVELTWVSSIGCVTRVVPVQWLSVDKR